MNQCLGHRFQTCMKVEPTVWEITRHMFCTHWKVLLMVHMLLFLYITHTGFFESWWWVNCDTVEKLWLFSLFLLTGILHCILYTQQNKNEVHLSTGVMSWTRSDVQVTQPPNMHVLKGSYFAPPVKHGVSEAIYRSFWYKPAMLIHRVRIKNCAFTVCNIDLKLIPKGVITKESAGWYFQLTSLWNRMQRSYNEVFLIAKSVAQSSLYFNAILIGHVGVGDNDEVESLDKDENLIDCWNHSQSRFELQYQGPVNSGTETWLHGFPDVHKKAETEWLTGAGMNSTTHRTSRCIINSGMTCSEFRIVRSYLVSRNLPIFVHLAQKSPNYNL
jgi:hypothetical protein